MSDTTTTTPRDNAAEQVTQVLRRTKRRYAHELYPHAEDGEIRSLQIEVPYLYALAVGLEVWNTSWFDTSTPEAIGRTGRLIDARWKASLADALLTGFCGQEAWSWAARQVSDETGELVFDRAAYYGVQIEQIKPYPCGPEPSKHPHIDPATHIVTYVPCAESECPDCTEEVQG